MEITPFNLSLPAETIDELLLWLDDKQGIIIKQTDLLSGTGQSTTATMTQKAITDAINAGYLYKGVATPSTNPGTPDANVFYLASGAGTYTNFGGIVINEGEVCALVWNGTWTKEVTGAATAAQVSQLGQDVFGLETLPIASTINNSILSNDGTIVSAGGYVIRIFDITGRDKVYIDKYIGNLNYCGVFCTNAGDIIGSKVGDFVPKQTIPAWISVPNSATYFAVNSYPAYEPNNVFAYGLETASKTLPKLIEDVETLGQESSTMKESIGKFEDFMGVIPLSIYSTQNGAIANDGTIQTSGYGGYVIRVFDVTGQDRVYIDKYIGNLNYCGAFCTNAGDIIGSKVGDFVPKQTTPAWISVPSGATYFAVNSYPAYEPNNIFAKILNTEPDLITIKEEIDALQKSISKKIPLSCVQWNVGQFADGGSVPTINPSNYVAEVVKWNLEVAKQGGDVCGLIEYNPIFGVNPDNVSVSPDDVVWDNYLFKSVFRQSPTTSWYGGCAVNSKLKIKSAQKVKYACLEGITAPDAGTQHFIDEVAFYTLVEIEYMGAIIKVAECAVPYNMSDVADDTYQRMVYQELADTFKNERYVILMGDFELVDNSDYDIFSNNGFALCNGGDFGWFPTCPDDAALVQGVNALDNIIIRGFDIKSVRMSDSILSDHFPLIAELEII